MKPSELTFSIQASRIKRLQKQVEKLTRDLANLERDFKSVKENEKYWHRKAREFERRLNRSRAVVARFTDAVERCEGRS